MNVLFLMIIFRLYPGSKMSFEHNGDCKILFLCACLLWESRHSLCEKDQNIKFGGTIGYRDSYLEFLFCHFKVFILDAILHDAAAAVPAHGGKGPGYCYMIARGANSCLLGNVTELLFCFYVKLSALHFQLYQLLKQFVLHYKRF